MIKKFFEKSAFYSTQLLNSRPVHEQPIHRLQSYPQVLKSLLINPESRNLSTMNDNNSISTSEDCDLRLKAHRICSEHLGGAWTRILPHEMSFMPISGGMSNLLYCCSLPDSTLTAEGEPAQVLLRLYGDQSKNCDMSTQLEIFNLLSLKDLGPKLFGNFEEGRLEEFLPASSLTCNELMNKEISAVIAKKLAAVHCLDVPKVKQNDWLLQRYSEWVRYIDNEMKSDPSFVQHLRPQTKKIAQELLSIDYREEIKFLRRIFDRTQSPMVFSHNDLHQGNILLVKHSKKRSSLDKRVILIDFEYCSYNYRAYDIANHFCEWCFEYDTPDYPHFAFFGDRLPTEGIQKEFIRNYTNQRNRLLALRRRQHQEQLASIYQTPDRMNGSIENGLDTVEFISHKSANGHTVLNTNNTIDLSYSNNNSRTNNNLIDRTNNDDDINTNINSEDEEAIFHEVRPFFMAANLIWTLWCIKSAHCSTIKFGYWEHAMTRWKLYLNFKSSFSKEAKLIRQLNSASLLTTSAKTISTRSTNGNNIA